MLGQDDQRGPAKVCGWARGTRKFLVLLFSALALLSSGCTPWGEYIHNGFKVGPNYRPPVAPVSDQWIDSKDARVRTEPADLTHWWTTFSDPVLDGLIQSAYRQNLSLRAAGFRVLEAQAQRGIAIGGFWPQQQALFGSYDKVQYSAANPQFGALPFRSIDRWQFGGGLAWELDFWGRFRRSIEAADAQLDASVENYDDVMVLLLAETADAYVDYRTAQQRLEYAIKNAEIQRGSLNIADQRLRAGRVNELDVSQARSNLAQTEALIPQFEVNQRVANNRLCVTLGIPTQDLADRLGPFRTIPISPPDVVVGIPAELLLRRPDVRRAEREVAAQSAQIGVATANLYPHISIRGTIYLDAPKLAGLGHTSATAGNFGPAFTWDLLNYGRLANNIRFEDARFQELAVLYQDTIVKANAEAENALVTFLRAQEQVKSLEISVTAANRAVEIVVAQYNVGTADFNRVFNLQEQLTEQQDALAVSKAAVAEGLIQVYKSLGGGWQLRLEPLPQVASVDIAEPVGVPAAEPLPPTEPAPLAPPPVTVPAVPAAPAPNAIPNAVPAPAPNAVPVPAPNAPAAPNAQPMADPNAPPAPAPAGALLEPAVPPRTVVPVSAVIEPAAPLTPRGITPASALLEPAVPPVHIRNR